MRRYARHPTTTGSALQTGLTLAAETVPYVVVSPFVWVRVDRMDRRLILIVARLTQLFLVGSIPLAAVVGVLTMPQILVTVFLSGSVAVVFAAPALSAVPNLVVPHHLVGADARLGRGKRMGRIVLGALPVTAVCVFVLAVAPNLPMALAALVVFGAVQTVMFVNLISLRQRIVPDRLRGRVRAVFVVLAGLATINAAAAFATPLRTDDTRVCPQGTSRGCSHTSGIGSARRPSKPVGRGPADACWTLVSETVPRPSRQPGWSVPMQWTSAPRWSRPSYGWLCTPASDRAPRGCHRIGRAGAANRAGYDVIQCVLGTFFFPDVTTGTEYLVSRLRPGGRAALTIWRRGSMAEVCERLAVANAQVRGEQPPGSASRIWSTGSGP